MHLSGLVCTLQTSLPRVQALSSSNRVSQWINVNVAVHRCNFQLCRRMSTPWCLTCRQPEQGRRWPSWHKAGMTGRARQNASGCWSCHRGDTGDVFLVALAAEEHAGRSLLLQALTMAFFDLKRVYSATQYPYLAWYAFSIRCRCFYFSRRAGVIKSLAWPLTVNVEATFMFSLKFRLLIRVPF